MKVLFRDILDSTLYCLVATSAGYDPINSELWFTGNDDLVIIPDITAVEASIIITNFYHEDHLDLRAYPAYINEEPLATHEER